MGIQNITTVTTGQVDVNPRTVRIICDNTLDEITSPGFLNPTTVQGFSYLTTDQILIDYAGGQALCSVSIAPGTGLITLSVDSSGVVVPTTAGHIATYTNDQGTLSEDANPAINNGVIQSGSSGTAGGVTIFPSLVTSGHASIVAANSIGNFVTTLTLPGSGQTTNIAIADPGVASGTLVSFPSTIKPITNPLFVVRADIQATFTALASGGSVNLFSGFTLALNYQFKILDIFINGGGINFSGGGGDRNLQITDGTSVYTVIPAASLQTLVNGRWGSTAVPLPASAAVNTSTVAGQNLVAKYSGGTADYTAGAAVLTLILQKVA